jgi:hypothetical protein
MHFYFVFPGYDWLLGSVVSFAHPSYFALSRIPQKTSLLAPLLTGLFVHLREMKDIAFIMTTSLDMTEKGELQVAIQMFNPSRNLSAFPQHSDFVEKSPARRGRRQDSLFP